MKTRILIVLVSLTSLFSCSVSHKVHEGLYKIRKGMSHTDVGKMIFEYYYLKEIDDFYRDDVYERRINNKDLKLAFIIRMFPNTREREALYLLLFEDDRLLYWGYPYEFTFSENRLYQQVGEEAVDIIRESYSDYLTLDFDK